MKYVSFFEENILGTELKCYIPLKDILICHIKPIHHKKLRKHAEFSVPRVYASSKSIKHSYDRRRSYTENNIEFIFRTIKDPDLVCLNVLNREGHVIEKRGDFIFFKHDVGKRYYAVILEVIQTATGAGYLSMVSFLPSKLKYTQKYPVIWDKDNPEGLPTLWDREDGGTPPS